MNYYKKVISINDRSIKMKIFIKLIIKLCITSIVFGYILLTNDLPLVFQYFFKIPPVIWFSLFLILIFEVIVSTVRLSLFFNNVKILKLFYVRLISVAYGFILPGQLAVEGVKIYLIGKENKKYSQPGSAIILDKLIGLIVILFLGITGLLITHSLGFKITVIFFIIFVFLIFLVFLLNIPFLYNNINKFLFFLSQKLKVLSSFFEFLLKLAENWQVYTKNKKLLVKNLIYGLIYQLLICLTGAFLTYSLGVGFIFFDWLWIHAVLTIVLLLPISLGGLGIREASFIGLLALIGINSEQALAVSFGFLVLVLVQALAGIGLEIGKVFVKGKKSE